MRVGRTAPRAVAPRALHVLRQRQQLEPHALDGRREALGLGLVRVRLSGVRVRGAGQRGQGQWLGAGLGPGAAMRSAAACSVSAISLASSASSCGAALGVRRAVASAALKAWEAGRSSTRGRGWAPDGPISPPGSEELPEAARRAPQQPSWRTAERGPAPGRRSADPGPHC